MSYATQADVQGKMPKFALDASSTPTATQAAEIQLEVYGELNVALAAKGIGVPFISDGSGVGDAFASSLKGWECHGTVARVLKAMFPGSSGPDKESAWSFHEDIWDNAMKGLQKGTMVPAGLGAAGAKVTPVSMPVRNPDAIPNDGVVGTPKFGLQDTGPWATRF